MTPDRPIKLAPVAPEDQPRLAEWLAARGAASSVALAGRAGVCWCAWEDGAAQAHVRATAAGVYCGGQPEEVVCLDQLAAAPPDQRLLDELLAAVAAGSAPTRPQPLLALGIPRSASRAAGFIELPQFEHRLDGAQWGLVPEAAECALLSRIDAPARRAMEDLYLAAARGWDGALVRDDRYWRDLPRQVECRSELILLEPEARGYARVRRLAGGALAVLELATLNPLQDMVVFSSIIRHARAEGLEALTLRLTPQHGVFGRLRSLGCRLARQALEGAGLAVRWPPGIRRRWPPDPGAFHWNAADWPEALACGGAAERR